MLVWVAVDKLNLHYHDRDIVDNLVSNYGNLS